MKRVFSIVLVLMVCFLLVGCTKTNSYTYDLETGDKIEVKLTMGKGYNLKSDLPFTITHDGKTACQGAFSWKDYYEQYQEMMQLEGGAEVIDEGTKDGNDYLFWNYLDKEYKRVIKIGKSNTIILLSSTDKEEAEKCFELLSFEEK